MLNLFKNIIIKQLRQRHERRHEGFTPTILLTEFKNFEVTIKHFLRDGIWILIGIAAAGFGLKGFLLPNSFIDGGVMGISLLTKEVSGFSLPILIVLINLPFLYLGLKQMGKNFAFKSVIAIILLALAIQFIPYPVVTSDKLLIAVFGGFFLGAGIGFSVRGGAVIDGTEVLAIYLNKKTGLSMGDVILIFNIIIFTFGAYILTVEIALYAILTYIVASKTVDFVVEGVDEYTGLTIISPFSEDIRAMLTEKLGKGVTIYSGKKGYGKKGCTLEQTDIVYTVITRLEIAEVEREVDKIDSGAFFIYSSINATKGGRVKKRRLDH
ncbi:MAG: YitT family protein [Bacteroidales bacterium]|nr:YitT family protein [Bacteroidales bacterium]